MHVDGAIGLWAAASRSWPGLAGLEQADSWSTDAHKWLDVPYDCCIVICRHQQSHRAAMTATASYLVQAAPGTDRDQVLVRFLAPSGRDDDHDARTRAVIAAVQDDATCWVGGSVWRNQAVMRISVSNFATTDADVTASAAAIIAAAR